MLYLGHVVVSLIVAFPQDVPGVERNKVEIISTGKYFPYAPTTIDGGPVVGNMLNAHYFPGINFYNGGRYREAEQEFTYVIIRPQYLEANPRRSEFMSTSYYLRGMIYFYHSKGLGRLSFAQVDFEAALKWNPRNYVVYLELSRLYSGLGFQEQAVSTIEHLLQLKPDEKIAEEARKELDALTQKSAEPTARP